MWIFFFNIYFCKWDYSYFIFLILLLLYYLVNSWINRVELRIAQVQLIYLTSLIFSSSSARLIHEPNSTSKWSSRVPNYIRALELNNYTHEIYEYEKKDHGFERSQAT